MMRSPLKVFLANTLCPLARLPLLAPLALLALGGLLTPGCAYSLREIRAQDAPPLRETQQERVAGTELPYALRLAYGAEGEVRLWDAQICRTREVVTHQRQWARRAPGAAVATDLVGGAALMAIGLWGLDHSATLSDLPRPTASGGTTSSPQENMQLAGATAVLLAGAMVASGTSQGLAHLSPYTSDAPRREPGPWQDAPCMDAPLAMRSLHVAMGLEHTVARGTTDAQGRLPLERKALLAALLAVRNDAHEAQALHDWTNRPTELPAPYPWHAVLTNTRLDPERHALGHPLTYVPLPAPGEPVRLELAAPLVVDLLGGEAQVEWELAQAKSDARAYELFAARHPDSPHTPLAIQALERLAHALTQGQDDLTWAQQAHLRWQHLPGAAKARAALLAHLARAEALRPGPGEVQAMLGALCDSGTQRGARGCARCPAFVWREGHMVGGGDGELTVGKSRYLRTGQEGVTTVALGLEGCADDSNVAMAIMQRQGRGWKRLGYATGVDLEQCDSFDDGQGRDLLVCSSLDVGQGEAMTFVLSYRVLGRRLERTVLGDFVDAPDGGWSGRDVVLHDMEDPRVERPANGPAVLVLEVESQRFQLPERFDTVEEARAAGFTPPPATRKRYRYAILPKGMRALDGVPSGEME